MQGLLIEGSTNLPSPFLAPQPPLSLLPSATKQPGKMFSWLVTTARGNSILIPYGNTVTYPWGLKSVIGWQVWVERMVFCFIFIISTICSQPQ